MKMKTAGERGLSLLELLAAMAILGTLMVLLFPYVSKMIQKSRLTECSQRMRQLGVAFQFYASENGGLFPTQIGMTEPITSPESWTGKLFPYTGTYEVMYCPSCPYASSRIPNSYHYNGWISLVNSGQNVANNRNPKELGGVRVFLSKEPSRDVLVTDGFSRAGSYAVTDESAFGMAAGLTTSSFPHPEPKNKGMGSQTLLPEARRTLLFVDGHVETRAPVPEQGILAKNWQWPVQ